MPLVCRGKHSLFEDSLRVVLTHLKLISNHRHFTGQFFRLDWAVDEPVGFVTNGPFEVVVSGREGFVIIRPVDPGRPVVVRSTRLQFLIRFRMPFRRLEQHVFQQVGHSRLAVALMARSNKNGHVHRYFVFGGLRKNDDFQTVFELILGQAFDRPNLFRFGRRGRVQSKSQNRQTGDHPSKQHV